MAQVIRHFEDHVPELQILLPFLVDRIIAEQRSENVARDGTCGVAVAAVIYGGDDAGGEIIRMPQRAVDGDGERLFRDPALTEPVDVFKIRRLIACQPDGKIDEIRQLAQMRVAREQAADRVARLAHDLLQRLLFSG